MCLCLCDWKRPTEVWGIARCTKRKPPIELTGLEWSIALKRPGVIPNVEWRDNLPIYLLNFEIPIDQSITQVDNLDHLQDFLLSFTLDDTLTES